ncbi:MAG TPA: MBL fold metallo-hydrolase [Bacteroidales bacterium]|nr:MBL fold metallo-hydrolase [Bacteroidales bacterium]
MKTWHTKSGYTIVRVVSGRSNVFLLSAGGKNILIDTGPAMMWRTLSNRLVKLNIHSIDFLILTHSHFDHAANAKRIKLLFGAKVFIHKSESDCLDNGINPVTRGTNFMYRFFVVFLNKSIAGFLSYDPCDYDYQVDTCFSLEEYGLNAYILHTPGHTVGSMSLIIDNEIAIAGDSMFGVFRNSIYPPLAADPGLMIESWGQLLDTGCSLFLPSHGSGDTRDLVEKEYNKRISHGK